MVPVARLDVGIGALFLLHLIAQNLQSSMRGQSHGAEAE